MSTGKSRRKVAVNVKILRITSFFALCASLCGLLSGLAGCAFSKAIKGLKDAEVKKEPVRVVAGKRINLPDEITVREQNLQAQTFIRKIQQSAENPELQIREFTKVLEGLSKSPHILQLAEQYPRVVEARYIARLNGQRSVITDMNSTEWIGARYYAIRAEARDLSVEEFDSSAYLVSLVDGSVLTLPSAYETNAYTGRVIIGQDDPSRRGIVYIKRGMMVRGGIVELKELGLEQLIHAYGRSQQHETGRFTYDAIGQLLEGRRFDVNGTQVALRDYRPLEMKQVIGSYTAQLGPLNDVFKMTLRDNGKVELYENGVKAEASGAWIFMNGEVQLIIPVQGFPIMVMQKNSNDGLAVVGVIDPDDGKRMVIPEDDREIFPRYVNPLPTGAILASSVRIGGVLIYDKEDTSGFALDGTVVEYYDAERTLLKREEPVVFGRHHGTVTWWYRNGKKQFEAEYVSGEPEGRTVWYRETQKGAPDSTEYEGFWTNGELTRATTWDAKNVQTGQVDDGDGTLTFHHPNGQKRMEEVYTNGKLTGNKFWDDEGNPVESVDPEYIPPRPRPIN